MSMKWFVVIIISIIIVVVVIVVVVAVVVVVVLVVGVVVYSWYISLLNTAQVLFQPPYGKGHDNGCTYQLV